MVKALHTCTIHTKTYIHNHFNYPYVAIPLKMTNTNTEMDKDKENPNTSDKMEIEHGTDNGDILSKQYELSDAQISRILDTDDDIDELQLDAFALIRNGGNTNTNKDQTTTNTTTNTDNSQTDSDSDLGLQNLTQKTPPRTNYIQQDTNTPDELNNGSDNETTQTDSNKAPPSTYRLLSNIPTHLHSTFQTLNNLNEKQIKTKTTLENLTTHKTDGTLPNNLNKTTDCHIILDDDLRQRWVQASRDAANKQLDILLEQHKRKLANIETKITHATRRIKDNITDDTQANKILQRTEEISQRFSARWLSKHDTHHHKHNKNVKRLKDKRQNRNSTPTHNATVQNRTPTRTTQPTTGVHTPLSNSISPRGPPLNTTPTYPTYSRNVHTRSLPTNRTQQHIRNPLMPSTTRPNFLHGTSSTTNPALTNHIQQQIQNFILPTHILGYLHHSANSYRK